MLVNPKTLQRDMKNPLLQSIPHKDMVECVNRMQNSIYQTFSMSQNVFINTYEILSPIVQFSKSIYYSDLKNEESEV